MKNNDDIVAFLLDNRYLVREYRAGENTRVITRQHMRLLACLDLHPTFEKLADLPALATFEDGVAPITLARVIDK